MSRQARTSIIGGDGGGRTFLGGGVSKRRSTAIITSLISMVALTALFREIGLLIGLLVVAVAFVMTTGGKFSLLDKAVDRSRIKDAQQRGTNAYEHYDPDKWKQLAQATGRRERKAAALARGAMRQMPSGADGMGWLERRPGVPGVAWHAPIGEDQYLSVTFETSGLIKGLESVAVTNRASSAFGHFQAAMGSLRNKADGVQTLTRILPPESARYEAWALRNVDPTAPVEVLANWDRLVRDLSSRSMIQRHYVTISWPLDAAFLKAAERLGEGRDGWRALMRREVESYRRRLITSGYETVRPLTASAVAAVLRHQQHPDWPIDQARDADPINFGMRSVPAEGAYLVQDNAPDGRQREWYHATAVIDPLDIAVAERTLLWMLPVLTGFRVPIIRTVSINRLIVPPRQAKREARDAWTTDRRDQLARTTKGKIRDDEVDARMKASQRRSQDMAMGTGHAGVNYQIAVSVSARSSDALLDAKEQLEERFDTGLGIESLGWCDTQQATAAGLTWPIARGLSRARLTTGDKFERFLTR